MEMVGKAKGKLDRIGKSRTMRLTIPAELASDTSFPFEEGDVLMIKIDGKELRVKKSVEKDD